MVPTAVTAAGANLFDGVIPADVPGEFRIAQVSGDRFLGEHMSTGDGLDTKTRANSLMMLLFNSSVDRIEANFQRLAQSSPS